MEQRGVTEVDVRAMLEKATGFKPSVTGGRFTIQVRHMQRSWAVIVEPDTDARLLVVVTVYEVLAKKGEVPPQVKAALAHYEPALAQFRARDFAGARERFQQALAVRPDDGPSKTYVERCTYFLEHPPEAGWDGVWHMKEK